MVPKIEIVHDDKITLGKGPHWDHEAKVLYYVDIFESTILKYDQRTTKITRVIVDKKYKTPVTWVIPIAGSKDKFNIGYGNKIAVLTWDGITTEPTNLEIIVVVDQGPDVRFNDGKADPSGRLWGVTIAPFKLGPPDQRKGALYSLNNDGKSVRRHFRDTGFSNSLAWSADHKTCYYGDSYNRTVDAFDFKISKGNLSNRRLVFDLQKNNITGNPDGMTIDKDEKLWVAIFGSGSVFQWDPNKRNALLQTIKFSLPGITSCTWGGPNLDELYVTCAGMYDKEGSHSSGCLFKVTGLGTSGFPGVSVKL